jgi:putative toxin-antitoxin system antitoxin component (TIGR02293 family)
MTRIFEAVLGYVGEAPTKAGDRRRSPSTETSVLRAPRVSGQAIDRLATKLGVSELVLLSACDISKRSYQHRKRSKSRLTEPESDRVLRVARIALEAERVFSDVEKAHRWLLADNLILGARPLELLATDAGAREVEIELTRIDFGDFA